MCVESVIFSLDMGESVCLIISSDVIVSGYKFDIFEGKSETLRDIRFFLFGGSECEYDIVWRVMVALSMSVKVERVGVVVRSVSLSMYMVQS